MRLSLAAFLALAAACAAQQHQPPDNADVQEFRFARQLKTLLDPGSDDLDFRDAFFPVLSQANGAKTGRVVDCLHRAMRLYKGKNRARYGQCREYFLGMAAGANGERAAKEALKRVSDEDVAEMVEALSAGQAVPNYRRQGDLRGRYVEVLGALGGRASAAVPALETLRDGPNEALAAAAFRALKKIRGEGP